MCERQRKREGERESVCVGGGIRWVLAERKWRTLRFGYEQLESTEGGCRTGGKKIGGQKTKSSEGESVMAG